MTEAEIDEKVNMSVYQPHLPIMQDRHRLKQLELKFGQYFSDQEQFEAFAMLPISDANRQQLVDELIRNQATEQKEEKKYVA